MKIQNGRGSVLLRSGLVLFCVAEPLQFLLDTTTRIDRTLLTFATAFLFGLSIALMVGGIMVKSRNRQCRLQTNLLEQK